MVKLNNVYERIKIIPNQATKDNFNHKVGLNIIGKVSMKIYHTRVVIQIKVYES